jgi:LPS-assembly protein
MVPVRPLDLSVKALLLRIVLPRFQCNRLVSFPLSGRMVVRKTWFVTLTALALGFAQASEAGQRADASDVPTPMVVPDKPIDVDFTANALNYDNETEIVTARGKVLMTREGSKLEADEVVWNRKSGEVLAKGNVRVERPEGDVVYGDSVALDDTLKDGVIDNMLLILADGGRLAANRASRNDAISRLDRASYTPCRVVDDAGCPKDPVWKISAVEVVHDPKRNRIKYKDATLELFGLPILTLPSFSHIADNRGGTGVLIPDIQYSRTNGFEVAVPYYFLIDRNRDLTVAPHLYTNANPAIEARYRALTGNGAYQLGGFLTYGSRIPVTLTSGTARNSLRGYLDASGKFQLTPKWSIKGSLRLASDRTFLRRYDISRDDRLRSVVDVERVSQSSYLSIQGWGFQTLRALDRQGLVPIALPIIDYRHRFDTLAGGRAEVQLNSLAITRSSGQDTQRAFASGRWDLRRIIGSGQEVKLTGFARGDVYHTDSTLSTATALYRGKDGWSTRAIAAIAAEVRWPLIGPAFGGTQRLTPRIQIVVSPATSNLRVPNEDARSVDLEDSNLFALNRFPGYDRWEDGTRITYGVDWALDLPSFTLNSTVGQSYRLNSKASLFPDGTGLTDRTSDIVGRTTIKFKRMINLTHRFRLDKDNLSIRRNELDATVGTDKTYATASYLRLNRNIGPQLEDLRDREEIRLGGRVQFARYWSLFGSTIVDLTDKRDDPISVNDGFEPVRHRLGVAYEDDCVRLSFTWKRDYDPSGDAKRGNSYVIRLSFRNLGR